MERWQILHFLVFKSVGKPWPPSPAVMTSFVEQFPCAVELGPREFESLLFWDLGPGRDDSCEIPATLLVTGVRNPIETFQCEVTLISDSSRAGLDDLSFETCGPCRSQCQSMCLGVYTLCQLCGYLINGTCTSDLLRLPHGLRVQCRQQTHAGPCSPAKFRIRNLHKV